MIRNREAPESKQKKNKEAINVDKTDQVLSSLPGDIVNDLEESVLDSVVSVSTSAQNNTDIDISPGDIFPEIEDNANNSLSDENIIQIVEAVEDGVVSERVSGENEIDDKNDHESAIAKKSVLQTEDLQNMLSHLTSSEFNRKNKWNISFETYCAKIISAKEIDTNFTKAELVSMLQPVIGKIKASGRKCNVSSPKYALVNLLSDILGDGSEIQKAKKERKRWSPLSLRNIAKKAVQQIPKATLNCVYAEHIFPERLKDWNSDSPFGKTIELDNVDCLSPQWYSMPEFNDQLGNYLFVILDAYHQLCGLRRAVCSSGMKAANISNKPFLTVAEASETNVCGLNIALVRDLVDKQSVAYAVQTFAETVEKALLDVGGVNEASLCSIIRNWYRAEDEPGVSAYERCMSRLELREWLLEGINFSKFPPSGASVKDIPIVLYEGLLTGIERRFQLYPFTKTGTYNLRSVGSLDIENFFGSFQDLDRRGTGVLRPDDIPAAIGVAVELMETRMNPDR